MFAKISALVALLPLASALTIQTPTGWDSGSPVNITWTLDAGDPYTWSFELVNPNNFHNTFGIANNVDSSAGFLSVGLPAVPTGDGYYLWAVNITDINDVYARSDEFTIGATPSTSASSSSTAISSSSSGSASASTTGLSSSTGASSAASSSAATSSAPGTTPTSFSGGSNGAAHFASLSSWVTMAIGAVAGAFVAL